MIEVLRNGTGVDLTQVYLIEAWPAMVGYKGNPLYGPRTDLTLKAQDRCLTIYHHTFEEAIAYRDEMIAKVRAAQEPASSVSPPIQPVVDSAKPSTPNHGLDLNIGDVVRYIWDVDGKHGGFVIKGRCRDLPRDLPGAAITNDDHWVYWGDALKARMYSRDSLITNASIDTAKVKFVVVRRAIDESTP